MARAALLLLCCAGLVLAASATSLLQARASHHQELLKAKADPSTAWEAWKKAHGRSYSGGLLGASGEEEAQRYRAWLDNLEYALQYNAKHTTHWIGLNALADLTHDEYKQRLGLGGGRLLRAARGAGNGAPRPGLRPGFMHGAVAPEQLPAAIDWREKGAVAEVKNQMACGSCWAFSTTGAIEGINQIVTGELLSLSEQFLVDCDTSRDKGCSGGLMDFAFEFVTQHGGIELEEDYPYTGTDGECSESKNRRVVTIDGYQDVPPNDEVALKKAVSRQPVSVAIQADQRPFQLYVGGVFDDEDCGDQLDHGVLAVGFGLEQRAGGGDVTADGAGDNYRGYWIVKNSWGAGWGDSGYIRIRMGRGHSGLCGIAMQPSYPLKTHPNPPAPPPGPGPKPKPPPPGPAPPPPKPGPVECDATHECPEGNTCCCLRDVASYCLSWGCCPMPEATCCEDKEHCCPSNLPICDTDSGRCLPPSGSNAAPAPWAAKVPARRRKAPPGARFGGGKWARAGAKFMRPEGQEAAY